LVSFIENWLILAYSERERGAEKPVVASHDRLGSVGKPSRCSTAWGEAPRKRSVARPFGEATRGRFSPFLSIYINDRVETVADWPLDGEIFRSFRRLSGDFFAFFALGEIIFVLGLFLRSAGNFPLGRTFFSVA